MTTAAFSPRGRYQKRGSGLRSAFICRIRLREQALLLVGLRDGDLVEVDPVGLRVAGLAEEEVVGANRRDAVAFLPGPGGVALARVDDRAGQVVGERRGLPAVRTDAAQGHRRVGGGRRGVRVQRGDGATRR